MKHISFVWKEILHILRDRRTMLILFAMPVVEMLLFGFAISMEVKNVRVGILNGASGQVERSVMQQIEASEYFNITKQYDSREQMESDFRKNRIDLVVAFSPNFENDLKTGGDAQVQLITDATIPNIANMQVEYARNIILSSVSRQRAADPTVSAVTNTVTPDIQLLYNPMMKSSYNFVPGVLGMVLMLICAMMTSISIVREKENCMMEVLLVSPVRPIRIILAKMVPYLLLSILVMISILLLSVFVLDVPIAGSLTAIVGLTTLFIISTLSLGLLISTLADTQMVAMFISAAGLMLPVMLLSGMIFPIENMPLILQWISYIVPARWYISAIRKLMIEGLPLIYVWKELSILLAMTLFFIVVSLKNFKERL
jgi:ABC-2 type transport system permease protein